MNLRQQVLFADPRTTAERSTVADACVRKLKLDFPAALDDERNSTERAYTGWPDRLYLIDRQGRVAYKSAPGPFGFRASDVAQALRSQR